MSSARKHPIRRASPPPVASAPSPVPKTPSPDVSLEVQLKCAQRELAMRKNTYPRLIGAGRMNVFTAEDEIARMAAIVKTLQGLVDGRKPG
jgi:hypothetical protein